MIKKFFIAVAVSAVLTFSGGAFADTGQMLDKLNNHFFDYASGCADYTFEQDGNVLIFHTGIPYGELAGNWRKYLPMVEHISRDWKKESGFGVIAVMDKESNIVFLTDNDCELHRQLHRKGNPKIQT